MPSDPISKIFNASKNYNIDVLLHGALYEEDPAKKEVYLALYHNVLGERQRKTINQKGFVR